MATYAEAIPEAALWSAPLETSLAPDDRQMTAQAHEVAKYKPFIDAAAREFGIPSWLICGLGSRESSWGLLLRPKGAAGTGDFAPRHTRNAFRSGPLPPDGQGFGRGLMQIDFDCQEFARTGNWRDAEANIRQACAVLSQALRSFNRCPKLPVSALQATIAAYNAGVGGVLAALKHGCDVDANTTGKNYSRDVFNRAGWFQRAGW